MAVQGYDGLLGLGPNAGSLIRKNIGKDVAETLIQRIFEANTHSDNYISFTLDRKNDPSIQYQGEFSISEVIPPFTNITSMPKLDVAKVNRLLKAGKRSRDLDPVLRVSDVISFRPTLAGFDGQGRRHHRSRWPTYQA